MAQVQIIHDSCIIGCIIGKSLLYDLVDSDYRRDFIQNLVNMFYKNGIFRHVDYTKIYWVFVC